MDTNPAATQAKFRQFFLSRLSADLSDEAQAALGKAAIIVPKPYYDLEHPWAQIVFDEVRDEGCNTIRSALSLLSAAATHFTSEKCTEAVTARADYDFNEIEEAKKIFRNPSYMPDFSAYDNDYELSQMQKYLVARQFFTGISWLTAPLKGFDEYTMGVIQNAPRVLEWINNDPLEKTRQENIGNEGMTAFLDVLGKYSQVLADAFRKLDREIQAEIAGVAKG